MRLGSAIVFAVMLGLGACLQAVRPAEAQGTDQGTDRETVPTVFAAASLKDALDGVNAAWEEETGKSARISYAATSALAKQIVQGAPADIFISADQDWMDFVEEAGRVKAGTRDDLLINRIVLIAPKDSETALEIAPGFPLRDALEGRRLAMANVHAVPAGKYGKAALQSLGIWSSVQDSVAQAQNVRAALALVARGEAPLGIVYRTDAYAEPRVRIVGTFPEDTHPPIIYPVAQLSEATASTTTDFIDFLSGESAAAIFHDQGFGVLEPD